MITAKAAKTQAADVESAETYMLKSDETKSRMPFTIGALISAIALFFKASASPSLPMQNDDPQPSLPDAKSSPEVSLPPSVTAEPILEPSKEPGRASRDAYEFAPEAAKSSSAYLQTAKSRASDRKATFQGPAANADTPPFALPPKLDYAGLFGDAADLADAWSPALAPDPKPLPEVTPSKPNRAPRAERPTYLFDVVSGAAMLITLTDLLANIYDPDGDVLTVVKVEASSGVLTPVAAGYLYQPAADIVGPVQLRFTVSDGRAVSTQAAHFSVVPRAIEGTSASETLGGTAFVDQILGNDGNDQLDGLGGSDFIFGGEGHDSLVGGAGNDVIFGGAGHDTILGGAGDDRISGDAGNDKIAGGDGDDLVFGDAGADVLSDGGGSDAVFGGEGDDQIVATLDRSDDVYDGGRGQDTLDYSSAVLGLKVDLAAQRATGNEIGSDTILNVEIVKLGRGNDLIVIGEQEVVISGGGGANTFEFPTVRSFAAPVVIAHQILDFNRDDIIKTPKYIVFSTDEETEELYDTLHCDAEADDHSGKIRYRHEQYDDEEEVTVVEWDNDDCSQLVSLTLVGRHGLTWLEQSG